MSWLTPNLTTPAQGLKPPQPTTMEQALPIEKIRASLLGALENGGSSGERQQRLKKRIHHAPDAQGLWELRGELMAVLATAQGEAHATAKLMQLTSLFRGVLPQGLVAGLDHRPHGGDQARNDASVKFRQQR